MRLRQPFSFPPVTRMIFRMASWKPRIVKPEDPVVREDGLLVYRYGRWSNLVAAQRGDRPRLVKVGEKRHNHWRHESGAELAKEGARVMTIDFEATGETLEEYYTRDKLLDALEAVGEGKRGTVEQSLREQLGRGGLPDPRRK